MRRIAAVVLAALLAAPPALADEGPTLQIHGFVSQGFIKTTSNNYLAQSKRGSFDFTEVGINVTSQVTDQLRVGVQIFAHDLGPIGNYTPQFDWYYLDYHHRDWLGLRAGHTKIPWGLFNEFTDIDSGRVAILQPQSVYPVSNREFLFAQTGGELYGRLDVGRAGTLEYRLYGGTIHLASAETTPQLKGFEVPYMFGGRLMWTPIEGLDVGASAQKLRLDFDYIPTADQIAAYQAQGALPANFAGVIKARIPAWLWVASAQYQMQDLAFAAEYTRSYSDTETNLVLPQTHSVNEGYYVLATYRVARWFWPGAYYSSSFRNIHQPHPRRSAYQRDLALTLRYDLHENWLVKIEGHYMHGTAGLTTALNDGHSLDTLDRDWGVLLLKTTAYF